MENSKPERNQSRRVDPQRTALSMDDHAARALNRFTGENPEDIETVDFKEGEKMRALVKAKLKAVTSQKAVVQADGKTDTGTKDSLAEDVGTAQKTSPAVEAQAEHTPKKQGQLILRKNPHTPEHKKYLETTILTALPSVRKAFAKAKIKIPSDDEILQAMIITERFTPEQIEALMRNIQVPGLIVLPPEMQSFSNYVDFLNANKKRQGQYDVFTSDSRRAAFSKQDQALEEERRVTPAEYKFGIGEMMPELANRTGELKDIVKTWEASDLAKLTRTATPRQYAVLQAQAKDLLDLNGWTILAEENTPHKIIGDDNLVSGAGGDLWRDGCGVGFDDCDPGNDYNDARVRPVVMVMCFGLPLATPKHSSDLRQNFL